MHQCVLTHLFLFIMLTRLCQHVQFYCKLQRRGKRNLCSHYYSLHTMFLGIMVFYILLIICSKLTFVLRCFNYVLCSFKQNYNVIHAKIRSFLHSCIICFSGLHVNLIIVIFFKSIVFTLWNRRSSKLLAIDI